MAAPLAFLPSLSPTIILPVASFPTSSAESVRKRRQYVREAQAELAQRGKEMRQPGYVKDLTALVKVKASLDTTFVQANIPIINETNCRNDLAVFKQQRQVEPFLRQAVDEHNGKECAANDHWKCIAARVKELVRANPPLEPIKRMPGPFLCQEIGEFLQLRLVPKQAALFAPPETSVAELQHLTG